MPSKESVREKKEKNEEKKYTTNLQGVFEILY